MPQQNENKIEQRNLSQILAKKPVRIPEIQRDYVQGRMDTRATEIRANFVQSLVAVVKGIEPRLTLDFVYGYDQRNPESSDSAAQAFEPLDGQQRLTTLFLLAWVLETDGLLCRHDDVSTSRLAYATRISTQEFCDELVTHHASELIQEARGQNKTVGDLIRRRDWFKWSWHFDPSVAAMLVMIDEIVARLGEMDDTQRREYRERLDNISFMFLDLGKLEMSQELYVKMNSRGKQLSDFDLLKSAIEQDLLQQIAEAAGDKQRSNLLSVQAMWQRKIDNDWNDMFWHLYAANVIKENMPLPEGTKAENLRRRKRRMEGAKYAEEALQWIIYRLIALQMSDDDNPMADYTRNQSHQGVKALFAKYKLRRAARRAGNHDVQVMPIDYGRLMADLDALQYDMTDDATGTVLHRAVTTKIAHNARWDYDDADTHRYSDMFIAGEFSFDQRLMLQALLLWLHKYPYSTEPQWQDNFDTYMRYIRNCYRNEGRYDRVDTYDSGSNSFRNAMSQIREMFGYHFAALDITDNYAVYRAIAGMDDKYSTIERVVRSEQKLKAQLIVADKDTGTTSWHTLISEAESLPYFWGEIGFLLNWSKQGAEDELEYNKEAFAKYTRGIKAITEMVRANNEVLLRLAMLVNDPYGWRQTQGNLFMFKPIGESKYRTYAVKNYMRPHPRKTDDGTEITEKIWGKRYRDFIDKWIEEAPETGLEQYCRTLIQKQSPTDWLGMLCRYPQSIDWYDSYKILDDIEGHVVMRRKKSLSWGYHDPVLTGIYHYAHEILAPIERDRWSVQYNDSNAQDGTPNLVEIDIDTIGLQITWGTTPGSYSIHATGDDNEGTEIYATDRALLTALIPRLKNYCSR